MVAAETFSGLNIHTILVDACGVKLQPCTVNGSDHYPGMAESWENDTDVDPANASDTSYAGVLVPDGNHDLDTVMSDNQRAGIAPPGTICWVLYVASGGALTKGQKVIISATDGYYAAHSGSGTALVRGEFIMDSDMNPQHSDVAAVCIVMIRVESGGILAAS